MLSHLRVSNLGILTEADLVRYAQKLITDLDRMSEAREYQ